MFAKTVKYNMYFNIFIMSWNLQTSDLSLVLKYEIKNECLILVSPQLTKPISWPQALTTPAHL